VNGYLERLAADPNAYPPEVMPKIRWRISITGQSLPLLELGKLVQINRPTLPEIAASEVVITLVPEKKQVPATLSGQVRNARGGKPVAARLELKELKQTVSCDESGQFSLQIPGGKYTIRISATGFVTQTKTVTVRDGDQAIFNLDLAPK
jgi:uncharacterized membrane protein